ncbi:response regulator [Virgibacillus oceani]|uniref:Sporulation initiation phosphotransferase F n=1 Tax=Virgibacillus oceani TaxID=1479511 RepID=A0A917MC04_9BACI|nr:response regulator [Virgibacillus oceani]GGG87834.1 sporulation initiation phosphotransferase F [Virgibacillus oceani]
MKKEILVVDDQPGIRLLLHEIFTSEGYKVTTAKTGKEALDKIHNNPFDLIMLDYKLPIIDGSQVLHQMEQEEIAIPAILMSGLAEDIIREKDKFSIVKEILAKPFNILDVCTLVKKLLK